MTDEAIIGATYYDSVFDDEFTIVDIEPDTADSVDDDEITLTVEYETIGTVQITLAQFRDEHGIELRDVGRES